jgi:hypothetical protein
LIVGKELYYGRNLIQEFWQSADRELLLMRVHEEETWSAYRRYGFLFFDHSAQGAAERLCVFLSLSQVWSKNPGDREYCLVPSKEDFACVTVQRLLPMPMSLSN